MLANRFREPSLNKVYTLKPSVTMTYAITNIDGFLTDICTQFHLQGFHLPMVYFSGTS